MEDDFYSKTLYGVFGGLIALIITVVGLVVGYVISQDTPDLMVQDMAICGAIALGIGVGLGVATFYIGSSIFRSSNAID